MANLLPGQKFIGQYIPPGQGNILLFKIGGKDYLALWVEGSLSGGGSDTPYTFPSLNNLVIHFPGVGWYGTGNPKNTSWSAHTLPNNAANNAKYKDIAIGEPEYVPINTEFKKTQAAVLPAENTGVAGIYHLRGNISLDGNRLFVSAMGDTPAKGQGDVSFWMKATVLIDGKAAMVQDLKNDRPGLWPEDGFFIIGSTDLSLPEPVYGQKTSLVLEGGYYFSTAGSPMVMPIPMSTEYKLDIAIRPKPKQE